MKRIIINGANGYVASNFINELLKQDYEVIALVRGESKFSSEQRMYASLMDANNGEKIIRNKLKVYNYSLLDDDFLLSSDQLESIFSKKSDYFHFAASLKYSKKTKEEPKCCSDRNRYLFYTSVNSRFVHAITIKKL